MAFFTILRHTRASLSPGVHTEPISTSLYDKQDAVCDLVQIAV